MKDRVFLLCGCFLFGLFLGYRLELGVWLLLPGFIFVCLYWSRSYPGKSLIILSVLTIFTGYLRMQTTQGQSKQSLPILEHGGVYLAQVLAKSSSRLRLNLLAIEGNPLNFTSWTRSISEPVPVKPGELVKVSIKEHLHSTKNGRLWSLLVVDSVAPVKGAPMSLKAVLRVQVHRLRLVYQGLLKRLFAQTPLTRDFLLAAILRHEDEGNKKWREGFENLGLVHIFSVSGFHVSLWGLLLVFFLNLCLGSLGLRLILYGAGILYYGLLAGFSTSVLRACLYSILLFSGTVYQRPFSPLRLLSLVLIVHGFIDPLAVLEAGFQLSYGITFFILWMSGRSHRRTFWSGLVFIIGLQLALIPFFLYHFSEAPAFSVLGVGLSIPLSWILAIGMVSLFLGPLMGAWSLQILEIFARPCEVFLLPLVSWGQSLDYFIQSTEPVLFSWLLSFYGGLYLLMLVFQKRVPSPDLIWLKRVEGFCAGLHKHLFLGSEVEAVIVKNAPKGLEKLKPTEHERILERFLALWRKRGRVDYLDFIRRGAGAGLLNLKIESEILDPVRESMQGGIRMGGLEGASHPLIQAYFRPQEHIFYSLEKIERILKFLVQHHEKKELSLLAQSPQSQDMDWSEIKILLKTLSTFKRRHQSSAVAYRLLNFRPFAFWVALQFFHDLDQCLKACDRIHKLKKMDDLCMM